MAEHRAADAVEPAESGPKRRLTPEAERALAEAADRRKAAEQAQATQAKELGGRDGPEPVRYGDWENKGIAVDF